MAGRLKVRALYDQVGRYQQFLAVGGGGQDGRVIPDSQADSTFPAPRDPPSRLFTDPIYKK